MSVRACRWAVGALGVGVGAYGAWLLVSRQRVEQLWAVLTWFVGGLVLHDVVLAGLVLVAGVVVTRLVPEAARAPVAVGAVVLGSVTLLAVPVLLRLGAKDDNPTLLDRDYGLGWLVVAGTVVMVVMVVAVATAVRARRGRRD